AKRRGTSNVSSPSRCHGAAATPNRAGGPIRVYCSSRIKVGGDVHGRLLSLRGRSTETMQARMALANTLRRLDRPDDAIAQYEKILAAAPTFSAALNSLGKTLHMLGRSEEAVAYFRRALDIDRSDLRANDDLGRALVALGRFDEARAILEKAFDL